ncbi:MAG: 3,4-dihydroxy-2-butanone-4-phosphate synthase [Bdellovibrionales bacterium]|nr:3,4-dihydroxy-2-butanone-4-phosphate synthase [Bdellovibrionales bacterium]
MPENSSWTTACRAAFDQKRPVILLDDTDSSGRSVVLFPAENATDEIINECIRLSNGASTHVALTPERAEQFLLEPMGFNRNVHQLKRGVTPRELVSVEARRGVTTGISAGDRATTVRTLAAKNPKTRDLVKPGHVFPVRVREGTILVRSALPEGAIDIVSIAGHNPIACYFELFSEIGEYLPQEQVRETANASGISLVTIGELIEHRLQNEQVVQRQTEVKLPTNHQSDMRAYLYSSKIHKGDHIAIVKGTITPEKIVLTRVHPEQTFHDVFGPADSFGNGPLERALTEIGKAEVGVLVYLRRPDTFPLTQELRIMGTADRRPQGASMKEFGLGAQILRDLGVRKIDLLSSSGAPEAGLARYGLTVVHQRPLGADYESLEGVENLAVEKNAVKDNTANNNSERSSSHE